MCLGEYINWLLQDKKEPKTQWLKTISNIISCEYLGELIDDKSRLGNLGVS